MKVSLVTNSAWTSVLTDDTCVFSIIDQYTSTFVPGYEWTPEFRTRKWDGKKHFFQKGRRQFPSGLVPVVVRALTREGYEVDIQSVNGTSATKIKTPTVLGIDFREYQEEAVAVGLERKRGIFNMATNAGKTEVMAGLISATNVSTLVIVHRKELKQQTIERFEKRLESTDNVRVEMVQTLHARRKLPEVKDLMKETQMILIDECHHLPANSWYDIVQTCRAPWRFGFSGTPMRGQERLTDRDLALIAATGLPIYTVGNDVLIEGGFSSKPFIEFYPINHPRQQRMSYHLAYDRGIVNNLYRNGIILDHILQEQKANRKVLVLVLRIAHGQALSYGSGVPFIHGGTNGDERKERFVEFKTGNGGALIASTILDEGIDVPDIDTLILAGAGKTPWSLLQRIGRGMRWKEGGRLKVVEFLDRVDEPRGILTKHAKGRLEFLQKQEGFAVKVMDPPEPPKTGLGKLLR